MFVILLVLVPGRARRNLRRTSGVAARRYPEDQSAFLTSDLQPAAFTNFSLKAFVNSGHNVHGNIGTVFATQSRITDLPLRCIKRL